MLRSASLRMRLPDVVCMSHVPWAMALERPYHVMRRLARERRVFYVEDPRVERGRMRVSIRTVEDDVQLVSLRVPTELAARDVEERHRLVVDALAERAGLVVPVLWIYSPLGARAAGGLDPRVVVYDCIDETSGAAALAERELCARADVVFTSSDALFEAKRRHNVSTYPVPSGVEADRFAAARAARASRPRRTRPRLGVLGVIDRRLDLDLVERVAAARPELDIDLVGPLAGLSREDLPALPNVRWLGPIAYDALAPVLSSWDLALVPVRVDDASRRVEPPGLLACLAAGLAVVTTPLDAVVERHGGRVPVLVASPETFVDAIDAALAVPHDVSRIAIDALLAKTSWERTVKVMSKLVGEAEMARELPRLPRLA